MQMGFPGYFLIVADFINWAKDNGVPVGPGRGSGAGSLVAYASASPTSIRCATTCCSSASSIPSACRCPTSTSTSARTAATASSITSRRSTAPHAVSQIVTFGTMAAKAVIRDVGRVLDLPLQFRRPVRQADPQRAGHHAGEGARARSRCSPSAIEPRRRSAQLWALAVKLEGLTRNVGMHAGGVLIAPGKLTDFCPLYSAAGRATRGVASSTRTTSRRPAWSSSTSSACAR